MSKLLVRCIFAGMLLVTAVSRVQISLAGAPDGPSLVEGFLERQGLTVHARDSAADGYGTVFNAPGCDRFLNVKSLNINLQEAPLFEASAGPQDTRHYIYLGEIRPAVEPVALRIEWIKHQMLATFGLAPYRQLRMVLFVAEPPGCDVVKHIDWRPFWSTAEVSPTTGP